MNNLLKRRFQSEGVLLIPELISPRKADEFKNNVVYSINNCAKDINVSMAQYLSAVSRWLDPSPITIGFQEFINNDQKPYLEDLFSTDLISTKFNIICKSPYARDFIPCHQDIAYSKDSPYEFSMWLALTDVNQCDGPLEILPQSHLTEISPAVDFWDPEFKDVMRNSEIWSKHKISYPVSKGDAILFDSRIWHGSAINTSEKIRIALVSRWKSKNFKEYDQNIPDKKPANFGMWTCGQKTFNYLKSYMNNHLTEYTSEFILKVIDRIQKENTTSSFDVDLAVSALSKLAILHEANKIHNGGDALGIVYADVWKYFLSPLIKEEVIV